MRFQVSHASKVDGCVVELYDRATERLEQEESGLEVSKLHVRSNYYDEGLFTKSTISC